MVAAGGRSVKPAGVSPIYTTSRDLHGCSGQLKLNAVHVDAILAKKLAEGLSPATVNRVRATLRRALGYGVDKGQVRENVVMRTRPAKEVEFEAHPLSAAEIPALLASIAATRLHPLVALAVGTGLRLAKPLP